MHHECHGNSTGPGSILQAWQDTTITSVKIAKSGGSTIDVARQSDRDSRENQNSSFKKKVAK